MAEIAAVIVIGVIVAGCLLGPRQPDASTASPSPAISPSATNPATSSPAAAPETSAPSGPPSLAQYLVPIPAALIHAIPLPAGAEVLGADANNPFWGEIAADGDWLATQFSFQGVAPGHGKQLYAVNIITGASRRLADHSAEASVANGRAAWVDPKCKYGGGTGLYGDQIVVCTAWNLHLMDLAIGSDRVVATGSITEGVSDEVLSYGDRVDVVPKAALSSDTLAYTTGDLKQGFKLHLLSISSGSERTVGLGGMIDEMRWAGDDLVWIEDTDLRHRDSAGGALTTDYYTDTRLMILQAGTEEASVIGGSPDSIEADSTGIVWTGQGVFYRASGPAWKSVQLGKVGSGYWPVWPNMAISNGWTGWFDWVYNPTLYPSIETYVVLRPQDSVPRVVRYGCDMSGGWLFLIPRDPKTEQPTGLEAVRIADLH